MMRLKVSPFLVALVALAGCGGSAQPASAPDVPPAAPPPAAPPAPATAPVAAPAASSTAPEAAPAADLAPYRAIVDAPDRTPDDKKLDEGRHPAELLAFIGVKPGMRVAEIGAAGGYTSELLARAVGPTGAVYGQNTKGMLERFAEKPWTARLSKPIMKNVVRVDREFDDPLPKDVHDLDSVVIVLFYHDTVWLKVDRDKMNHAILAALKPGGSYVVVDHRSRDGAGTADTESLHRIEESVVREEVQRAGFRFASSADFLKNPSDTRDWSTSPRTAGERRGTSDRFVLKFVKP
jgi:predicted methyltransferase